MPATVYLHAFVQGQGPDAQVGEASVLQEAVDMSKIVDVRVILDDEVRGLFDST